MDEGFRYRIPDGLETVSTGAIVRVPLAGRRVRGFVTDVVEDDPTGLKDVLGMVGDLPVLTPRLLETLRWAAIHYVAPLAVLLAKAAPPNAPRRVGVTAGEPPELASPLPGATAVAVSGGHVRPQYLVGGGPWDGAIAGLTADVLRTGRNAAVVAATVAEAHSLAAGVGARLGMDPLVATSAEPAADATRAWGAAMSGGGQLVVGTREIAFWALGEPAMIVVVEEGRPAMTAPQTPTTSTRDVVRRRGAAERFGLVLAGPVPTVEALAAGAEIHEPASRVWPLIEVIDRSEEPPGGGVVMEGAMRAILGAAARDERVFVFVSRRGDAVAFRCVACGALRRCASCGAAVTRGDGCARCGSTLGACATCGGARFQALGAGAGRVVGELRRRLGARVTPVGDGGAVVVGTERDLPSVGAVDLAVVIDADALILAPHYRAEEDALRTLARAALTVGRGRGRRCLVQTGQARHRVFATLRHGHATDFLRTLLAERELAGFPPVSQLLAVEVTGAAPSSDAELREAAGTSTVLGPAGTDGAQRWLVSGADLRPVKLRLRGLVQRWRDAGMRVRIDADPVRL